MLLINILDEKNMNSPERCASPDLINTKKSKQAITRLNFIRIDDPVMFPENNRPELEITMMRADYQNKRAANYHCKLFSTSCKSSPNILNISNRHSL